MGVSVRTATSPALRREMAKAKTKSGQGGEGIYKIVEIVGSSPTSWDDAARVAVETASGTLRDLRIAEVNRFDVKIEDGKVVAYRVRVSVSFKYEGE